MRMSQTTRIAATLIGGVFGVGALVGASAPQVYNDPSSSSLERRAALVLKDVTRGTATIVSLDVPWEPGDTVSAVAEAPVVEPVVEDATASDATASRSATVAPAGVGQCGVGDTWPNQVRSMITTQFGITNIGGYRPGDPGDHGSGLALDVMVLGNSSLGDSVAAWAVANMGSLNVSYVIWQQRINMGGGWSGMEDRGSITANHYDHVHISLHPGWGSCG